MIMSNVKKLSNLNLARFDKVRAGYKVRSILGHNVYISANNPFEMMHDNHVS